MTSRPKFNIEKLSIRLVKSVTHLSLYQDPIFFYLFEIVISFPTYNISSSKIKHSSAKEPNRHAAEGEQKERKETKPQL